MSEVRRFGLTLAALSCVSGPVLALNPGDAVDNFRLTDEKGQSHELYYLSDMKAVVLMATGNGCDAARATAKSLGVLRQKYQAQGVEFLAIDSNLEDTSEAIAKEIALTTSKIPVLIDDLQLIGESLGLTRNGEVLIVNAQNWHVIYRGAAAAGSNDYVAAALDAALSGTPVKVAETSAQGCAILMPERDRRTAHAQISYEKTIAPMLSSHCVACHREGGIAPWQMSSYDMVLGFSPMIREVVRTKRMPPWHADPHYGVFSNDRSLSKDETKTLVHWIEAGSPRGTGSDPLTQVKKDWPVWALGKPDLVVNLPKFEVPATGVIPYQMWTVDNPLDHDVWVRAIDFLPGVRSNLHHIIATIGGEMAPGAKRDSDGSLADYVPGSEPLQIPPESGILLKKGAKFGFQAHYTVNGKEATDVTQMGLYFMDKPPQYRYRAAIMANPKISIPANTKLYTNDSKHTFDRDVLVYSLHPHAHFRGSAAEFVALYPDGHEQVLLNVPRYEFNWQTTYVLKTPIVLPAGTTVRYSMSYDNSTQNKANPDPNRVVPWGQQTWDEMLFGVIRYRNTTEDANPARTAQTTE
ncbi:MAG TPA: redoxin domain-containing protein [Steroidobacteraceae bacterium]|nr:redoxin domain-containing protein [Steroidobacteraceae bacterium]